VPSLQAVGAHLKERMKQAIIEGIRYAQEHGIDRPEFRDWTWPSVS
jgi:xylulose-5-phosphate/fructose-6-phosphate phosphoketolase